MSMRILIRIPRAAPALVKALGDGKQKAVHDYLTREKSPDGTHWIYKYANGAQQHVMNLDDPPATTGHQAAAAAPSSGQHGQASMEGLQPAATAPAAPAAPRKKLTLDRYGNYGLVEMLHHHLPKKRKRFAGYEDDHKIRQRVKRDIEIDVAHRMRIDKDGRLNNEEELLQQARTFLADFVDPYYATDADGKLRDQYQDMETKPLNCAVRLLVNLWASTSGDSNKHAMAMQVAAAREFELKDAEMDHMGRIDGKTVSQYRTFAEEFATKHAPFLQRFLRAQYDHTQREFQQHKAGPTVVVYRGVKFEHRHEAPPAELAALGPNGGQITTRFQPMSSCAAMYEDADVFAGNKDHHLEGADEYTGYIMAIEVPNSMILSTARTGYGCLHESEVVILGGEYEAFVMPAQDYTGEMMQHEWHRERPITRVKKPRKQADFIRAAKKAKVWSD